MAAGWLSIVALGALLGVLLVGVLVGLSLRRNRALPPVAPERDAWEEALLADTTPPPTVPGYAAAPYPPPVASEGPEVLDRAELENRGRSFDPTGWDDRPDGFEGTDMGLVGGDGDR